MSPESPKRGPEIPSDKITIAVEEIDKIYTTALNRRYGDLNLDATHNGGFLFQTEIDDTLCKYIFMDIRGSDRTAVPDKIPGIKPSATNLANEFNFVLEVYRSDSHRNAQDPSRSYISERIINKMLAHPALSAAHAVYETDIMKDQRIRFIKNNIYFGVYLGFRTAQDHINALSGTEYKHPVGFTSTSSIYITMENLEVSKDAPLYEHYVPLPSEDEFRRTMGTFADVSEQVLEAFYRAYGEPLPTVTLITRCPEIKVDEVKQGMTPKVQSDGQHKNFHESSAVEKPRIILACESCRNTFEEEKFLEQTKGKFICPSCGSKVHTLTPVSQNSQHLQGLSL